MRALSLLGLSAAIMTATACIAVIDDSDSSSMSHAQGDSAAAVIEGRSGSSLSGLATFVEVEGGVQVTVELHHTTPGWHAVHIHEKGDCSAADGTSAGGHFNPGGHAHGAPHAPVHHAGDLGNVWVNDDGSGYHVVFMPELTVDRGSHGVIGRGIIVHEKADDLTSQPTGAAGGRIGCGEIR